MSDAKKSPWLGSKQDAEQAIEATDLPMEVYEAKIEDDDVKLARQAANARLLETVVPPESKWKVCWACGKKVPMLFRFLSSMDDDDEQDPMDGVLVCRACHHAAHQYEFQLVVQEFLQSLGGLVDGIGAYIGNAAAHAEEGDEGEGDEGEVAVPMIVSDGSDPEVESEAGEKVTDVEVEAEPAIEEADEKATE